MLWDCGVHAWSGKVQWVHCLRLWTFKPPTLDLKVTLGHVWRLQVKGHPDYTTDRSADTDVCHKCPSLWMSALVVMWWMNWAGYHWRGEYMSRAQLFEVFACGSTSSQMRLHVQWCVEPCVCMHCVAFVWHFTQKASQLGQNV